VLRRGCGLLFGSGSNDNGASCLPAYVLPNASGGRCRGWRQRSSEVDVVVALQSKSGADCHNAVGNMVAIIINMVVSSSGTAHLHVHAYQRQRPRHEVLHRAVLEQLLQRTVIRRVAACERMRQGHPPLGAAPSTACTMRRLQRSWGRPATRLQAQTATCYVEGGGGSGNGLDDGDRSGGSRAIATDLKKKDVSSKRAMRGTGMTPAGKT
jgi:hypothetical protein